MSPDKANAKFGRVVWRCNSCGATENLEWWNGLSVAVCIGKEECHKIEAEKYAAAVAELDPQELDDEYPPDDSEY